MSEDQKDLIPKQKQREPHQQADVIPSQHSHEPNQPTEKKDTPPTLTYEFQPDIPDLTSKKAEQISYQYGRKMNNPSLIDDRISKQAEDEEKESDEAHLKEVEIPDIIEGAEDLLREEAKKRENED